MASNPVTYYSTQMAQLLANTGGAVQSLPNVTAAGARERVFVANLAYAAQTNGSSIAIARLPLGAIITGITVITDTSTGSATLALGDAGSGNAAIYAAAQAYTTTNTPTRVGLAATHGAPITTGYDAVSGNVVNYKSPGEGGALYEDIVATVGSANLPGSGNLVIIIEYAID